MLECSVVCNFFNRTCIFLKSEEFYLQFVPESIVVRDYSSCSVIVTEGRDTDGTVVPFPL